jgi:hypothetical protein
MSRESWRGPRPPETEAGENLKKRIQENWLLPAYRLPGVAGLEMPAPERQRFRDREVELYAFTRDSVAMRASKRDSLSKCQDTLAMGFDKDRRVQEFAVADGVSKGGHGSQSVADLAVRYAVNLMRRGSSSASRGESWAQKVAVNTEEYIYNLFDPLAIKERLKTLSEKFRTAPDNEIDEFISHSSGGTTLTFGSLDLRRNLHVGVLGDGGCVVVGQNGLKMKVGEYERAKAPPQIVVLDPRDSLLSMYHQPEQVVYSTVPITSGDTMLAFTDGALKGNYTTPEEVGKRAAELIAGGKRLEQVAFDIIREAVGRDDVTILIQRY